ncbi:MAG: AAA family ATPase [Bacteroidales bacterium]|nr:AAA family ATPase [Bacteroidales bacterium]
MQSYIDRLVEPVLEEYFNIFPVIALLGPRQCGKSTLAKHIIEKYTDFIYLDLEKPSDLRKMEDPELFFQSNETKRVCIDEVQY